MHSTLSGKQRGGGSTEGMLEPKVWIVVNHLIRLKGLAFRSSQSGPQQRALRQNLAGPYGSQRAIGPGLSFLDEDMHNYILSGAEHMVADTRQRSPAAILILQL
jgi:hypothetical protein